MREQGEFRKRYFKYLIIFPVALILVSAYYIKKTIDKKEYKDTNFYQYIAGQKIEYEGQIVFDRNEKISELKFKDITIELDSTPIYYEKDNKTNVIFPETMNVAYPASNGLQYELPYFSILQYDGLGTYDKKYKSYENCFIYDFKDLYFFVEKVTITVGETEYNLEPFSYAIITPNQPIEIYDKQNDEYYILDWNDDVKAHTEGYTIDLAIDSISYGENQRLLIKNKKFLKSNN